MGLSQLCPLGIGAAKDAGWESRVMTICSISLIKVPCQTVIEIWVYRKGLEVYGPKKFLIGRFSCCWGQGFYHWNGWLLKRLASERRWPAIDSIKPEFPIFSHKAKIILNRLSAWEYSWTRPCVWVLVCWPWPKILLSSSGWCDISVLSCVNWTWPWLSMCWLYHVWIIVI